MEAHEILDRYELLYSSQAPILSDIRRVVVDEDLSSIFRIASDITQHKELVDEFRKSVIEKNSHAIFRIVSLLSAGNESHEQVVEDLRKAVVEENYRSIFRVIEYVGVDIEDLRKAITEKNHYSIFRVLEGYGEADLEDLRKITSEDLNLHALFRLLPAFVKSAPLEDLRKAIVEDNLHSLFRLIVVENNNEVVEVVDDLRRAVMEKNWHSVFRSLEYFQQKDLLPLSMPIEDLRKAIIEENMHSIFRVLSRLDAENREMNSLRQAVVLKEIKSLMEMFIDNPPALFDTLPRAIRNFPEAELRDAFSRGQIASKKWLVEELVKLDLDLGTVFLCAGWYSSLALLLFESGIKLEKIRSFDIDPTCYKIADTINRPYVMDAWKFKAQTGDITEINYRDGHTYDTIKSNGEPQELYDKPNTVINTSCEHITNFSKWHSLIPVGTLVILQTNDYFEIEDHVNCVNDIDEFKQMAPLTNVLYEGVLNLEKYNRYMLIGYR